MNNKAKKPASVHHDESNTREQEEKIKSGLVWKISSRKWAKTNQLSLKDWLQGKVVSMANCSLT